MPEIAKLDGNEKLIGAPQPGPGVAQSKGLLPLDKTCLLPELALPAPPARLRLHRRGLVPRRRRTPRLQLEQLLLLELEPRRQARLRRRPRYEAGPGGRLAERRGSLPLPRGGGGRGGLESRREERVKRVLSERVRERKVAAT